MRKSDLHRSLRDEWEDETFQHAIEMYDGDEAAAKAWLRQSVPVLEGRKPLELMETEAGAVLVENLIGRIEAGVYS